MLKYSQTGATEDMSLESIFNFLYDQAALSYLRMTHADIPSYEKIIGYGPISSPNGSLFTPKTNVKFKTIYHEGIHYTKIVHPFAPQGLKVLHISDTHFKGKDNKFLKRYGKLQDIVFDLIVHSGDIVENEPSIDGHIVSWLKSLKSHYKLMIPGNHDDREKGAWKSIVKAIELTGFVDASYKTISFNYNERRISVTAMPDRTYLHKGDNSWLERQKECIKLAMKVKADFRMLLTHRPDDLTAYIPGILCILSWSGMIMMVRCL